jgi:hypothetical protein
MRTIESPFPSFFLLLLCGRGKRVWCLSPPYILLISFRNKKQLQSNKLKEILRKNNEEYMTTLRDKILYVTTFSV